MHQICFSLHVNFVLFQHQSLNAQLILSVQPNLHVSKSEAKTHALPLSAEPMLNAQLTITELCVSVGLVTLVTPTQFVKSVSCLVTFVTSIIIYNLSFC